MVVPAPGAECGHAKRTIQKLANAQPDEFQSLSAATLLIRSATKTET